MDRPETRFAWNGDIALAFQVIGDGASDLVFLQGWCSNVELNWDNPVMARFLRGLGGSRRVIVMDPRGVGCSERSSPNEIWPLETVQDDLIVVMDAAGSERAAILATNEEGFVAMMFAATFPERTEALILHQASANFLWSEETPWEWTEERFQQQEEALREPWTRETALRDIRESAPSLAHDRGLVEWWYRYSLLSEGFGHVFLSARKYKDTDVRPILPSIQVPTLVLARPQADPDWVDSARYLARHIPGAKQVDLPGADTWIWAGDQRTVHTAIDDFLGGVRKERSELERVLATVLFTDIVASTERASSLGDDAWRDLIEAHNTIVRALLARFQGKEIDTAGDGFFATFDGPARGIRCAEAINEAVRPLGVQVRAGLHTGECETIDGKVGGMAVIIGARVAAVAGASEILVTRTVRDLVVGSGLAFEDVGEHELKGVADVWRLYRVTT